MADISDNKLMAASDIALMEKIGGFIKHHRLQQNKTQEQLALEAGIARSTLGLCERGENISLLVFIQLLRALKLLYLLHEFQIKKEISPLLLADLEQSKRKRAARKSADKKTSTRKSDW